VKVATGKRSDTGRVRQDNEDSFLVAEPLFLIADGMGGHLAGDVASQTAVAVIEEISARQDPSEPGALQHYVEEANSQIHSKAAADPAFSGMGTTCTLMFLDDSIARFAHVGDSRAYLLRDGELNQITEDHTLVQRMVAEGRLDRGEAAHHPQRNIVTRSLGVEPHVQVDTVDIEVRDGDRILLCSDGLTSMVDDRVIADLLTKVPDPQDAADRLVDTANLAGGEDNVTVLVVDLGERAEGAPPPPPVRHDTAPDRPDTVSARAGRSWPRRILITVVVVAVLGGGGYAAARWSLSNSYFVGTTEEGLVAIYTGIPEEIAGLSLREEQEVTDLHVEDLPETFQDDVTQGIKVSSLEEARDRVADLEDRAEEFAPRNGNAGRDREGSN
jgi:protein phosphatase